MCDRGIIEGMRAVWMFTYITLHVILFGVLLALKHNNPNEVNKSYSDSGAKVRQIKILALHVLNPKPFQKGNLHGVLVKDAERERGEADPEGRREQCDKTWLSLAVGNYLHVDATPGNPSGSTDKDEDKRLKGGGG